jgi:hypothetical protein
MEFKILLPTISTSIIYKHNIKELNVLIFTHGIVKDHEYKLGIPYDSNERMGNPKFISSTILTRQLENLSNLVDKTYVVSVACYGKKLLHNDKFSNFKNTLFCFLSDKYPTHQGDIGICGTDTNLSKKIDQSKELGFFKDSYMSYSATVQKRLHAPDLIYKNGKEKKAYVYTIPQDISGIFSDVFPQLRLEYYELTDEDKKEIINKIEGARAKGFLNEESESMLEESESMLEKDAFAFLLMANSSGIDYSTIATSSWKDVQEHYEDTTLIEAKVPWE